MTVRRWLGLGIVAVLVAASGCARPEAAGGDRPDPGSAVELERVREQARDALARWDAAVAAGGDAQGFVPIGELTDLVGIWEPENGSNNKAALTTGRLVLVGDLPAGSPAPGQIWWADGTVRTVPLMSAGEAFRRMSAPHGDCTGCRPLAVTGAWLATGTLSTNRGVAKVPVWEFTLRGTSVRVTRVAVALAGIVATPPPWDANNPPAGESVDAATVAPDGRRLTVHFVGSRGPATEPCGTDYVAEAVESANAVVVILTSRHHKGKGNAVCTLIGYSRTATVDLARPLGDRAVLEVRQGSPVPVTSTG